MRTVAAIQARLGSTRLPDKVLADLDGQPMVVQIARRLAASDAVDQVVDGVHVRADTTPWSSIGRKAVARALSDVAAMAARPLASIVAAVNVASTFSMAGKASQPDMKARYYFVAFYLNICITNT